MKSLVGGTFGKYEVNKLLGKGGMGEVYEAFDTDKGRSVALKVLTDDYAEDETFRTRFLRESRAAAILQEPHVIPIHDWGEIDHTLYIDMRLVNGQTLHEIVKARALKPQRAVDIIRQVAAALDAAHAQGLIHRDVKPQNIIVTPDDFAYLVDFGIAEAKGDTPLTLAGYQVGSFAYMAPERFGDQETTAAVDIYSLACVLFEALTGRPPFTGHSQQVIAAHLSSSPPRASAVNARVPAALDDVIARGMAKHPDDRYGSAGALARAAKRALLAAKAQSSSTGTVFGDANGDAPTEHAHPRAQSGSPPRFPDVAFPPGDRDEGSGRYLVPTLVLIAAALVVVAVVLVVVVVGNQKSDPGGSSPAVAYPTSGRPTYQAPYETTTQAAQPTYQTTTPSTTRPVDAPSRAPSAVLSPEQQLRQISQSDWSFVNSQIADRWVPQLSAKRPGVVDNGVTWDLAMALNEHLQLRQRYGARLLWSGEWSTFSSSNFWVTVADVTFGDSRGALAWCKTHGFDRDHCIAKIVSRTRVEAGSTAYN